MRDYQNMRRWGENTVGRLAALFVTLAAVLLLAGCDIGDTPIALDGNEEGSPCLTFSDVGFGPVRETWQCFDRFDRNQTTPLAALTRLGGISDGFGGVSVAGTTDYPAVFRITGLDRRWDFGCDERENSYLCAFTIEPGGSGLYCDFTASTDGTAKPSDFFDCLTLP